MTLDYPIPPHPLPPARDGAKLAFGPTLPSPLGRRLEAGELVMVLARSSSVGEEARRAVIRQIRTAARRLVPHDLGMHEVIPSDAALMAAQVTSKYTTSHPRHGMPPFPLNVTLVHVTGTQLLIALITGSGAQLDEDFNQPAIAAAGALLDQVRPFLTVVPELTRVGRDGFGFAPFAKAYRRLRVHHGEPAWLAYEEDDDLDHDPEAMRLEPYTKSTERRLFEAGVKGRAYVDRFASQATGGARTALLKNPVMEKGCVVWPTGTAPMPGIAAVRRRGEGRHGRTYATIESPEFLPDRREVLWGMPEVLEDDGSPVDQWATIVWLFKNIYLPEWTDEMLIGAELDRRRFSWASLRKRTGDPTATLGSDPDRIHRLLELLCRTYLDDYFHRVLRVKMPNTSEPVVITGLPLALDEASRDRIARRWNADVRPRERRDTHLFTGAPVHLVDDHLDGVLEGTTRGRDDVTYHLRHVDSRVRLGGRDHPVSPLREQDLLQAMLTALAAEGGSFTRPATREPADVRRLRTEITQRAHTIAHLEAAQAERRPYLDPPTARVKVQAGVDPERVKVIADTYLAEAPGLRALIATQRDDESRLQSRERDLGTGGIPVHDLLLLPRALVGPTPPELRGPILDSIVGRIQVKRPLGGNGATPDKPGSFEFQFQFHDPSVGTRVAFASGDTHSSWQRHTAASLHRTLQLLTDGVTAADLNISTPQHHPLLLAALVGRRTHRVLKITDSRLVAMTMQVCHPLLPLHACVPGERFTGPALDEDAICRLAHERGWPEVLLRRIRDLYLTDHRVATRWLRPPSPMAAALYARGRRGRVPLNKAEKVRLRDSRTSLDWDIHGATGTLIPCATCGSRRLHLTRLDEIAGARCAACGHDRAGVHWGRAYVQYVE